jgi:hypothetical protein
MQDKRLVNRLHNYWNLIRKGNPMPDMAHLNPGAIEDMWQQCIDLEILAKGMAPVYNFRHMGERLLPIFGQDMTGSTLNIRATQYPYNIVVSKVDIALKSAEFVVDQNIIVNDKSKVVKYRACFMPFGNLKRGVTNIVVGYSCREF